MINRRDLLKTAGTVTFFNDYPDHKASNPVVSDDGRFMAFQLTRIGDPAGVGHGILKRGWLVQRGRGAVQ